jgi:hypothetical protein
MFSFYPSKKRVYTIIMYSMNMNSNAMDSSIILHALRLRAPLGYAVYFQIPMGNTLFQLIDKKF